MELRMPGLCFGLEAEHPSLCSDSDFGRGVLRRRSLGIA